jgi:deoxyadenosine/deoxycytidine kinase
MTVEIKHIAVAGNIGAGKTTLTRLLANHYDWEPHFEDADENPYISDFYEDMQRWSFHMQIFYLNKRFSQIMKIRNGGETVIQDRTIYEDVHIFAPNLHAMGLMSMRDFTSYSKLFKTINELIKPPDLLIYLRAGIPKLVEQIQKRGRAYEDSLRLDYLKRLNERYEAWIDDYEHPNLMIIDIDKLNFAENPEHLGDIISKIDSYKSGLLADNDS